MAINSASPAVTGTTIAGRVDRLGAEARQGQWMLVLERSMLAAASAAPGGVPAAPQRPPTAEPVPASGRGDKDAHALHGAAPSPSYSSAPRPLFSMAASKPQGTSAIQAEQKTLDIRLQHESTSTSDCPHHAATTWHRPTHAPAHPSFLGTVHFAHAGALTVELSAAATLTDVAAPAVPQTSGAGQFIALVRTPSAQAAPVAALQIQPTGDLSRVDVPDADASDSTGASSSEMLGERPEFDKRMINILVMQDGVHAFIRDADINAYQMRQIAHALSEEVAGTGQKLAALMVNGRTVDARASSLECAASDTNRADRPASGTHSTSLPPPRHLINAPKGNLP
jgi:hypothetical protein